ncbi:MAG: DUF4845 domain-containing protein [Pseudomonadota bacterium]
MKFGNRQKGLGVAGWLVLILLFGGAMTIGMKLFPVYMDHSTMANVLDGLAVQPGLGSKRNSAIEETIQQRFKVNNIRDFNLKKNMKLERDNDGVRVILDYEVRVPLIANVDLVASFDKEVTLQN